MNYFLSLYSFGVYPVYFLNTFAKYPAFSYPNLNATSYTLSRFLLMLSLAVMISICHAVVRLPGYLSWNVPFDGADNRPITKELSSCIHALPVL